MTRILGVVLLLLIPTLVTAQSARDRASAPPRTPWGAPDLRGIWDYWTFTPLERPSDLADRATLTDEEAAKLAQRLQAQALGIDVTGPPPGDPGAYGQQVWTDRARAKTLNQT